MSSPIGSSGATPPCRRVHRVRVEAPGVGASAVLEAIGRSGVVSRDVLITRGGVCVDAEGEEGEVWDLGREIGGGEEGVLVAPVLEG